MFAFLLNKLTWNYNKKQIDKIYPILDEINKYYISYKDFDDEKILENTNKLRDRYLKWESLDLLLPEAFANLKKACFNLNWREFEISWEKITWNMVPYDVQLLWWIVLHNSWIAEMKTWEWKTLVATLPIYLNALSWKWAHLVTVNDYLASRDAEWMSILYNYLWLSVWSVTKSTPVEKRREEYSKDITYVENSELWFDYLRDNLVWSIKQRVLLRRPLNFAIIDEADSILIDEARTPLIISQPWKDPTDKYTYYSSIVKQLQPCEWKKEKPKTFLQELISDNDSDEWKSKKEEKDYYIDEKIKTIQLTSNGISRLESILWVENLYKDLWYDEIHHIENALKAWAVYHKDKDYIVKSWEVMLVDEHTWRITPGRRFSEWLHQALEAKEWLVIQKESQTVASITYQNFFKQYNKIAGMTGTAMTEAEEFEKIYELRTLPVPTNKDVIRVDKHDKVYFSQDSKWSAVMNNIKFANRIWQPILIWTSSINTSEIVSEKLRKEMIQHYVLNAKYHEQEANIIKNAGKIWSVVVATNMAWRWTDIKLEDWLNSTLADNYVKWIDKEISLNKNLLLNIYSEIELSFLKNAFNFISDENLSNFSLSSDFEFINNWISFKLEINKKRKSKDEVYAKFLITSSSWNDVSYDEYDIHFWLYIVWTEKHESRRIDNQLRGRAGRQWDPGVSQFFVALDDEIMRKMWGDKIKALAWMLLPKSELDNMELTQKQFTSSIERSQKQMEWWLFSWRKHLFDYDSVINKQRLRIYSKRDIILFSQEDKTDDFYNIVSWFNLDIENFDIIKEIEQFIPNIISRLVETYTSISPWDIKSLNDELLSITWLEIEESQLKKFWYESDLRDYLVLKITEYYNNKLSNWDNDKIYEVSKLIYLSSIDRLWVKHIDEMQQLREKVSLFWYAQLDPLIVYKKESYEKFQKLLFNIQKESLSTLLKLDFDRVWINNDIKNDNLVDVSNLDTKSNSSSNNWFNQSITNNSNNWIQILEAWNSDNSDIIVVKKSKKMKPNDPCSCWSWKKYKKCCWAND